MRSGRSALIRPTIRRGLSNVRAMRLEYSAMSLASDVIDRGKLLAQLCAAGTFRNVINSRPAFGGSSMARLGIGVLIPPALVLAVSLMTAGTAWSQANAPQPAKAPP